MKALITGVTSGIGLEISKVLFSMGYEIIGVSKDLEKLEALKEKYGYTVYKLDLSNRQEVLRFCEHIPDVEVFVNNAGFGDLGYFCDTDLSKDLSMIEVNLVSCHILTKAVLKQMLSKNNGYILNVSSSASFMPGPLMCTYYSTKSYVTRMSLAIYEEIRRLGKNVNISVLCPGPVNTNFNNVAGVNFSIKGCSSSYVAKYAIKKMFKKKLIIIPTIKMKVACFFSRFIPRKILLKITFNIQRKKK